MELHYSSAAMEVKDNLSLVSEQVFTGNSYENYLALKEDTNRKNFSDHITICDAVRAVQET